MAGSKLRCSSRTANVVYPFTMNSRHSCSLLAALGFLMSLCPSAHATLLFTIQQSGSDVVETATGTVNLAALAGLGVTILGPQMVGAQAITVVGNSAVTKTFSGITGPASFGPGSTNVPGTTGGGYLLGINGNQGSLYVPNSYLSGSALSGTATYSNTTLATLGLTPGLYLYTWGSGASADSATVDIVASTPEPGSLWTTFAGFLLLAAVIRARPGLRLFNSR